MISGTLNQKIFDTASPRQCDASDKGLLKNALCPYYDNCIDWALKEKWGQFTCQGCGFQDYRVKIYPNADEMNGYYRLLAKIFTA